MPRYITKWTEEEIARRTKEGRGKGAGADYRPWIDTHDFGSRGTQHRIPGLRTGRDHHFHSSGEASAFKLLEWRADTLDIREQFPLERAATVAIAKRLGVRHPRYPGTDVPTVMTTDLLRVFGPQHQPHLHALDIKVAADLANEATLAKLEIARRYFAAMNIRHSIVVTSRLNQMAVRNIESIRSVALHCRADASIERELTQHGRFILQSLSQVSPEGAVEDFCLRHDERYGCERGTAIDALRLLLWQRSVKADLETGPLEQHRMASLIVPSATRQSKVA